MAATLRIPGAVGMIILFVVVSASSPQESCAGEEFCRLPAGTAMMQVSSLDLRGQQLAMDSVVRDGGSALKSVVKGRSHSRSAHAMRVRSFAAYGAYLSRKMSAAHAAKQPAITELNDLVGKFIDQQSNSEDKCSSQMLEAKHQLNQLHDVIDDLSEETNSTQVSDEVLDKQLQDKKDEEEKVEDWKNEKLRECEEQVEERTKMLVTLKQELIEMQHIARPNVTMDIQGGTAASGVALLEETASDPFSIVEGMLTKTKSAAVSLQQCVQGKQPNWHSLNGTANATSTPEECLEQKESLEKLYVKTYVKITRLITENEELIKSTSCKDSVHEEYSVKITPIRKEIDELVDKIENLEDKLEGTRPRLEDAHTAEKRLREQIKDLTEECETLPETISDLDKVRDAITAMGKCPGLNATEFNIPMWTKEWVAVTQNSAESDAAFDARMNAACVAKFGDGSTQSVRSAEVSEIIAAAIEGMPLTNTAGKSIVGACPLCAGDSDDETGVSHADGHARVCWDPDTTLSGATMRKGCSNGIRAVLCVLDRGNIRNQARDDLASDSASFAPPITNSNAAPQASVTNGNNAAQPGPLGPPGPPGPPGTPDTPAQSAQPAQPAQPVPQPQPAQPAQPAQPSTLHAAAGHPSSQAVNSPPLAPPVEFSPDNESGNNNNNNNNDNNNNNNNVDDNGNSDHGNTTMSIKKTTITTVTKPKHSSFNNNFNDASTDDNNGDNNA